MARICSQKPPTVAMATYRVTYPMPLEEVEEANRVADYALQIIALAALNKSSLKAEISKKSVGIVVLDWLRWQGYLSETEYTEILEPVCRRIREGTKRSKSDSQKQKIMQESVTED